MEACPVCGNHKLSLIVEIDSWRVLECDACRHGVVSPFPSSEHLSQLYNSDYFVERYLQLFSRADPAFGNRIRHEEHRVRFVKKICRSGSLLDIGCGCGYFVYAAQQGGLQACGSDVVDVNRSYIEEELGCKFLVGALADLPVPEGSLDILTMWHTLEHHPDPAASIRQCWRWLKPSGVLIVEVPNHDSFDARHLGASWPDWDLPFHLHHFSAASLRCVLENAGGEVMATKTYHSQIIRKRLSRTVLLAPFARMIASLLQGGSVLMACRQKTAR